MLDITFFFDIQRKPRHVICRSALFRSKMHSAIALALRSFVTASVSVFIPMLALDCHWFVHFFALNTTILRFRRFGGGLAMVTMFFAVLLVRNNRINVRGYNFLRNFTGRTSKMLGTKNNTINCCIQAAALS
jgi:hypothetical protein